CAGSCGGTDRWGTFPTCLGDEARWKRAPQARTRRSGRCPFLTALASRKKRTIPAVLQGDGTAAQELRPLLGALLSNNRVPAAPAAPLPTGKSPCPPADNGVVTRSVSRARRRQPCCCCLCCSSCWRSC